MVIVFDLCNKIRAGQKQWGVGVRLVMQGLGGGGGGGGGGGWWGGGGGGGLGIIDRVRRGRQRGETYIHNTDRVNTDA